jgi:GntR family transcriptional regulator
MDTPDICGDPLVSYAALVTVDHDSAVPLYLQVAGLLRARIESGELHSRVPSLKTIAQEYGVSHVTAEKAVQVLKDEGLVEVVIGKGIYVRRRLGLAPSSSRHNLPAN